jgi:hypothetical protein
MVRTTEKDLFLRAAEALTGEVDKRAARIPLDAVATLGIVMGDVIEMGG